MSRHLQSCLPNNLEQFIGKKASVKESFFHIQISGVYAPVYWLHLIVGGKSRLKTLDQFLRDIWLECCGHLSAFIYQGNDLEMGQKLEDVFNPGMKIEYQYDFGSTTYLLVNVLEEYQGRIKKNKPVQILARNKPPEILCDECGNSPAVKICPECQWEDSGWFCQSCAEKHECDEDIFLPVLNSPRTGECGYTGE